MSDSTPDIIVTYRFFEHGKSSSNGSSFRGKITHDSIFKSDKSFFNYTGREDATEDSVVKSEVKSEPVSIDYEGSFADYTSRENATKDSVNDGEYFTMSSMGRLYTEEQRTAFREANKNVFCEDGDLMWEIVVSFPDKETLNKYGFVDQNDLSKVANLALNKALPHVGFDMDNIMWWQDYHTNKKNPHMHITFAEKDRNRTRGKFTEQEKFKLTSAILTEIGARKKFMLDNNMLSTDMQKQVNEERKEIVNISKELPYIALEKIANLYSQLPKSGRLQYNSSFMIPYRKQLDEIVDDVLKHNEIKEKYELFVQNARTLDQTYYEMNHQELGKFFEQQDKRLRVQIANDILRHAKDFRLSARNWKEEKGNDLLCNELNKLIETDNDETYKDFYQAIKDDMPKKAFMYLNSLPDDSPKAKFIKGSFLIVHGRNETERNTGKMIIYKAFEDGDDHAKHYHRHQTKSIGFNKRKYNEFSNKLSPKIRNYAAGAISQQEKEIEDEIDKFIRDIQNQQTMNSGDYKMSM